MKVLYLMACIIFVASTAAAKDVTFTWDASDGQVEGYRILYGDTEGGPYPDKFDDINATTQVVDLSDTQEYYLVVRAFNRYGESGNSNEVYWNYEVPSAPGVFDWETAVPELLTQSGADCVWMKFTAKD